jgi:succinate dehydrogenase / fumarate reductase flavoprotein subunit
VAKQYETDVLIVGAGGAGLRAAIAAREEGARVLVVCKSLLGKAHTVMAEGGIAAALGTVDKRDTWEVHFRDTMMGGKMLNDWRAAEIHAKESAQEVVQLERWGALFDRTDDGRIIQRIFGGHTYPRLAHVGDRTGLELIRTLQAAAVSRNIDVLMEHTVPKILVHHGAAIGVVGYARSTGETFVVGAPSIIIATGGAGKLYTVNSNSWEGTGDGQALALDAGAELADMEFVQFHPTGMTAPASVHGLLVTEAVRGEGGVLLNAKGERFMKRYDPERMELSTRDIVARAIYTEVHEGRGSPSGGAYLSISHKPAAFIRRKLPSMYTQFLTFAGIDITREPMEVFPTTHYAMGGIRVDPQTCETSIRGLFAAGEAAAGLHGANRLGGNSLSDLLVFGRRAGSVAAARSHGSTHAPIPSEITQPVEAAMRAPLGSRDGEPAIALFLELGEIMMKDVGVFRRESGLRDALLRLEQLRVRGANLSAPGSMAYNPGWHSAIHLPGMVELAIVIARSALAREESRGAHTREDFPESSSEFGPLNTVTTRSPSGEINIQFKRREPMPERLSTLLSGERA